MIIGVTGGIASGKTAVSDYLQEKGYPVVDADILSREIMAPGSPTLSEVRAAFGNSVFHADGSLNRQALGRRIFGGEAARRALDAITHPAIVRLAQARFDALGTEKIIFFVVPLLYESGMDALCDRVWLVHADENVRRRRLMARDDIDAAYAEQKMTSQMSETERLAKGAEILTNDGDLAHLKAQVEKKLKKLEKSVDETDFISYNKSRR